LETKKYILREVQASDINNIHQGLSNSEITKYYDVHFATLEATKEQMDWYSDLKKKGTGVWWCIFDKETQQFCGAGGFNDLDKNNRKAEIGFWLLKDFWGKGIMTEVISRLFEYGFNELNLNRIEGFVVHENNKCKSALEKINFTYEGTLRDSEIKNNELISVDVYSVLKNEWS